MARMRPEDGALKVLQTFSHGANPATPVDPVQIARHLGINVWSAELSNDISGELVKLDPAPDADIDIYLNSEHSPSRQRFTCAHELGHYFHVLEDHPELDVTFVFRRDSLSSCGTHTNEIFANQFAAALLMPESLVRDLHRALPDAFELASHFKVSPQSMGHRLVNLGLPVS